MLVVTIHTEEERKQPTLKTALWISEKVPDGRLDGTASFREAGAQQQLHPRGGVPSLLRHHSS